MTIEAKLDRIIELMELNLTKHDRPTHQAEPAPAVPAPVAAAPVVAAPTPVAAPIAAPAPVVEAPLPAATDCPIVDQQSLVQYVMDSYKALGPVKGNQIQGVLAACGITHINETKPEQYPAIFNGIESLKAQ